MTDTNKTPKTESHAPLSGVSMSYGFQISKHIFEIEADSEKDAMMILVRDYWGWIDKNEKVELLGGREK